MPTARGVWENIIATLVVMALVAVAAWGISHIEAPITLWVVFVIAVFTALFGFVIGLIWRFGDDLLGYQADLLGEAILALRNVIAGKINVSFEDFIERGVLAPARFGLSVQRGEEIRLSVLVPEENGENFKMLYESGHSLGRKRR